jgi:hypothetical protein
LQAGAVAAKAVEMGLAATTAEVNANARATATLALIHEQAADSAGQYAREANTLAGAQQRANAEFENAKATLGGYITPFVTSYIQSLTEMVEVTDDSGTTLEEWMQIIAPWGKALGDVTGGADSAATAVKDFGSATGVSAQAARDHADAVVAQQEALESLDDVLRAQTDPIFAVLSAQEKLAAAQQAVTDAVARNTDEVDDNNVSAEEMAAIQLDVARAADDVELAMLNLAVAVENGNVDLDTAVARLRAWQASGLVTAAQAAALEQRFRQAAAQSQINGRATMDASQAIREVNQLISAINRATGTARAASAQMALTILGSERQHGGPVEAGRPYIVGERQPELFVPRTSGVILPSVPPMMSSGGRSGGGGTTYVTVNTLSLDPEAVVSALRRYERSNGTSWRN